MADKDYEFHRYIDRAKEWRWRLKAPNGRIIADSAEGFSSLGACDENIALVKKVAPKAKLT